jgi:hypothetical protein
MTEFNTMPLINEQLEKMLLFMSDKQNSYDRHLQEKAYWTCYDCINILIQFKKDNVIVPSVVKTVVNIFNRYKFFV